MKRAGTRKAKRAKLQRGLSYVRDARGKWRWRLVAGNYRIIDASSQGFATEAGARRNARRVRKAFAQA